MSFAYIRYAGDGGGGGWGEGGGGGGGGVTLRSSCFLIRLSYVLACRICVLLTLAFKSNT
jgi:hypothetical protein